VISYSDFILANRPWAYWPLNDPDLGVYNETHLLMDVTGNERHLSMSHNLTGEHAVSLPFSDSVPIRGIRVGSNSSSSMPYCTEDTSKIWLASGHHSNDVYPENPLVSHTEWMYRVRAEFLMSPPPQASYGCAPMMYPIIMIGGVSLWMHTIWFRPCDNCGCVAGASNLILSTNIYSYCIFNNYASSEYSCRPIHWLPYFIRFEGQTVQTGRDSWAGPLYDATGTGMLIKDRRVIIEVIYIDSKTIIFSAIFDDGTKSYSVSNQVVSLPAISMDYRGGTCSDTFTYPSNWPDVAIYGGPTISNLSVYYNNTHPLTYDYIPRSWQALTTTFQPGSDSNVAQLSDNVNTSRIADVYPNSMLAQLDTMLCRGMSQRVIYNLTATNDSGQSVIRLMLPHNSTPTTELPLHDFSIGDLISLQGSSQNLNAVWRVESIDKSSVSFSLPGTFNDETGVMLVKRPPIGGGAWAKTHNGGQIYYRSATSQLGMAMQVDDTSKSGSALRIFDPSTSAQSNVLYLRRNLKRPSTHYQPDTRQNRPEWTIIGDDKRFYIAIGYKQNPKTHSQLIVFGDIRDWADDVWRTMLLGFVDLNIGNPGFNGVFAYSDWSILASGHLLCQTELPGTHSDSRWVRSNSGGSYEYIKAKADSGQRMYPIPIPRVTI
jgi:hypothetical protein